VQRLRQGGDEVFRRQAETVLAVLVRRADLHEHDVRTDPAAADQRTEPREGKRQHVGDAGIDQPAVVAGAAIGGEAQPIGVLRLHRARVIDAEKDRRAGVGRALRKERLHQRLGLGGALSPEHAVAGTHQLRQIQHARAMLPSVPVRTDETTLSC
jgi:hypothetical protein